MCDYFHPVHADCNYMYENKEQHSLPTCTFFYQTVVVSIFLDQEIQFCSFKAVLYGICRTPQ